MIAYDIRKSCCWPTVPSGTSSDEEAVFPEVLRWRRIQIARNRTIKAQNLPIWAERHRPRHVAPAISHGAIVCVSVGNGFLRMSAPRTESRQEDQKDEQPLRCSSNGDRCTPAHDQRAPCSRLSNDLL